MRNECLVYLIDITEIIQLKILKKSASPAPIWYATLRYAAICHAFERRDLVKTQAVLDPWVVLIVQLGAELAPIRSLLWEVATQAATCAPAATEVTPKFVSALRFGGAPSDQQTTGVEGIARAEPALTILATPVGITAWRANEPPLWLDV